MSGHQIRPGVVADAQMVGEVSFRSAKDEDLAYHVAWWTYYLGDLARAAGYQMFVAELDGDVVGFTMVGPVDGYDFIDEARGLGTDEEVAVLHSIHVDPAYIGRGIGKDLLSVSVDHLRSAGFRIAVLDTDATNDRARRFYEAGGWTVVGTVRSGVVYQLQLD
jgi:ribosomal protein S18 acetylase RimI-like enzyme